MGLSFSNVHIKKNEHFDIDTLIDILKQDMTAKGLVEQTDTDNAEIALCVYNSEESGWITIASDYFNFGNADSTKAAAAPFSERFETDVIAATCVDSDFIMMNLINSKRELDGWINAGNFYGPKPRRTSLAPWKSVVSDYEKFCEIVKSEQVFAEDVLYESAKFLGINSEQCALRPDSKTFNNSTKLIKLYFSSKADEKTELPKLEIRFFNLTPCKFGENKVVFVNNKGGKSKGVAVMFWGGFVENDELIIENVTFEAACENNKRMPITLKKMKCIDGQTILYWEDKNFIIPQAVNQSLPFEKLSQLESEKTFGVRFYVSGNPRKLLDVKVSIIPLENRQHGSDTWFVYRYSGSKKKYIEKHNRSWGCRVFEEYCLDPDDFDL